MDEDSDDVLRYKGSSICSNAHEEKILLKEQAPYDTEYLTHSQRDCESSNESRRAESEAEIPAGAPVMDYDREIEETANDDADVKMYRSGAKGNRPNSGRQDFVSLSVQ